MVSNQYSVYYPLCMTFSVLHCIFILMVLLNNIIFLEVMLYEGKPYMYVLVKCYHAEVHVFCTQLCIAFYLNCI